jgi:hypothetical protein
MVFARSVSLGSLGVRVSWILVQASACVVNPASFLANDFATVFRTSDVKKKGKRFKNKAWFILRGLCYLLVLPTNLKLILADSPTSTSIWSFVRHGPRGGWGVSRFSVVAGIGGILSGTRLCS